MAGDIKGITIEFRGETTKLSKALNKIKDETKGVDGSLKAVNKALKFNPGNIELLGQKQIELKRKIEQTKEKLEAFKEAQRSLDASGVDKTSSEYMEVRRNIIQAESQAKYFNAELKKTEAAISPLGKLGSQFQDVGGKITAAGHALAPLSKLGAAVAGGLGALAVKAGRAADDLNTLSKTSGINTKQLQLYAASADLVDVSVEDMAKSQTKLKKNMLSASQGTGDAARAFDMLGVNVKGADGHLRNQDEVFQEVIRKLGTMSNETERDALAMQIFGKSATALNPMIEDMGKTYKLVTDTMKKNKIKFVDQETLDQANAFNDQIDIMKFIATTAFQQIGSKLAAYLVPAITKVQEVFSHFMGIISNLSGRTLAIITGIGGGFAVIAPILLIVGGLVTKMGLAFSGLSKIMPGLGAGLKGVFGFLKANPIILIISAIAALALILSKTGLSVEELSGKINGFITNIVGKLPGIVNGIVALLPRVLDAILKMLPVIIDAAVTLFTAIVNALPQIIPQLIQGFVTLINGLVSAMPTLIPILVNGAVTLFQAIVNALPQIIPLVIQGFTSLVTTLINAMPTLIPILIQGAITLFIEIVKAIPVVAKALIAALPLIIDAFKTGLANLLPAIWTGIKNTMVSIFGSIVNAARDKLNAIKDTFVNIWNSIKQTTANVWEGIKNAIMTPINGAANLVKAAIDKIKGLFNFSFKWPHLPLPHFSISGSINPLSKSFPPKIGVSWYKEGGIFDKPSLIGVGEAGREAVLPTHKLDKFLDDAIKRVNPTQSNGSVTINIANMTVRDDTDIRKIADEIERRLALESNRRKLAGGLI
jgi:phage tail tape measure protein, tp901 family, core region, putative